MKKKKGKKSHKPIQEIIPKKIFTRCLTNQKTKDEHGLGRQKNRKHKEKKKPMSGDERPDYKTRGAVLSIRGPKRVTR